MGTNENVNIRATFTKCHLVLCRANPSQAHRIICDEMRITECTPNLGGFVIFFRELKLSLEIVGKQNAAQNDLNLSM